MRSTFGRRLLVLGLVFLSFAGLLGYTRLVQISQGGTGASTAAGARTSLGIEGLRTDADPLLCTDATVVYTGSASPVLPDAASCGAGQRILVYANAAATLTLTRAGSDTIDGGTTSAITLQAGEGRALVRESSSSWRSVQAGAVADVANEPRSVLITVRSDQLCWIEQYLNAGVWTDLSGSSCTTLSVDTDGGATFAGTTATLASGWPTATGCASQADERYLLISSLSATLQALIATGKRLSLQMSETSMGTTLHARWGCALAVTGGTSLDATSECIGGIRAGYTTGSAWSAADQYGTGSYGSMGSGASMGAREYTSFGAGNGAIARALLGSYVTGTGSPKASLPDRIYWLGGAAGAATTLSTTTDVVAPVCRLVAEAY